MARLKLERVEAAKVVNPVNFVLETSSDDHRLRVSNKSCKKGYRFFYPIWNRLKSLSFRQRAILTGEITLNSKMSFLFKSQWQVCNLRL